MYVCSVQISYYIYCILHRLYRGIRDLRNNGILPEEAFRCSGVMIPNYACHNNTK